MHAAKALSIYPGCPSIARTIRVGGMSKPELLADFQRCRIKLNQAGQTLFAHDEFQTSEIISVRQTVEISVCNLGYAQGATMTQIHERSAELGLTLCPLELGPHFRLQYLDQPEGHWGHPPSQNRAPPGSITVASPQLTDDDLPKGFYLRRIEGVLWLRGYHSGTEHLWSPDDRFVFCSSSRGTGHGAAQA